MHDVLTADQIEKVYRVTDGLLLNRDWVVVPLRGHVQGLELTMPDGKILIRPAYGAAFDAWYQNLRERLEALDLDRALRASQLERHYARTPAGSAPAPAPASTSPGPSRRSPRLRPRPPRRPALRKPPTRPSRVRAFSPKPKQRGQIRHSFSGILFGRKRRRTGSFGVSWRKIRLSVFGYAPSPDAIPVLGPDVRRALVCAGRRPTVRRPRPHHAGPT